MSSRKPSSNAARGDTVKRFEDFAEGMEIPEGVPTEDAPEVDKRLD